jgi:hypothetical protein
MNRTVAVVLVFIVVFAGLGLARSHGCSVWHDKVAEAQRERIVYQTRVGDPFMPAPAPPPSRPWYC